MDLISLVSSNWYGYILIPFLIFIARIFDVTLGTIRVICIAKGHKLWAPLLGFFEVVIWLMAIQQIMVNLNNWFCYLAYGAGFAGGTLVGMIIEEKLAIGKVLIRVITSKRTRFLLEDLRDEGFEATLVRGEGLYEHVRMIFIITKKQKAPKVINMIKRFDPHTFYTIGDVNFAFEDKSKIPPKKKSPGFGSYRKGK
jgi:uncharacterized protein YebE (UPF0316 family)